MIEILHDLMYAILPEFIGFWYLNSCGIYTIRHVSVPYSEYSSNILYLEEASKLHWHLGIVSAYRLGSLDQLSVNLVFSVRSGI